MNQPNAPALSARPAAPADAPNILSIVRRFKWLLIAGTILGTIAAGVSYYLCKKYIPRYRADVKFQVLPPPAPLANPDVQTAVVLNPDDTSAFIRRQKLYIEQERILNLILQTKEFQTDSSNPDDNSRRSQWLTENWSNPLAALKRDFRVTPLIDSGAFEISMTTRDPNEAYLLVTAAQKVYLQNLRADNKVTSNERLEALNRIRQDQEATVASKSAALNQFRQSLNIPALTSRHNLEVEALQQITSDMIKARAEANSAKMRFDLITKQMEEGKLELTSEMQQYIKEDFQVRQLESVKLQLQQEKAAIVAGNKGSASPRGVEMIDARIATVDDQIRAETKKLEQEAKLQMQEMAENRYNSLQGQAEYIEGIRKAKEDDVKLLESSLIQYQQKVDDLKAQEEILEKLRRQDTLQNLNSNTDDTRVQTLATAVAPDPKDFVWPNPYVFFFVGSAGGLLLSFGTAYLLVLTDTRVRTPRDISKTLQLPLLGFVPDETDDPALTGSVGTAMVTAPMSMITESFRGIRSQLSAQTENSPINTLLVASIAPGGGATTVASNLAMAMAMNERRVLLVDVNFYRPGLKNVFKNLPAEGFTDALEDPAILNTAIIPSAELPRLHLLGAGRQLIKAGEIVESKSFRDLLETLKSKYDLVIFDGAPLNLVSDSLTLSARVDGVVPVVRAGEVSRGTVTRIREQLRQVHANMLGFVLNAAKASSVGYFKENYRSFYQYAGDAARRGTR